MNQVPHPFDIREDVQREGPMQPEREDSMNGQSKRHQWIIGMGLGAVLFLTLAGGIDQVWAIDVHLAMDDAKKALAAGRGPMEKANTVEEVAKVIKAADKAIRIGADLEKNPCGTSAILKTKTYWLEYFGRREAAESKRLKQEVHMPEPKIQEILEMPYLELEVGLCGEEEFFAEGVQVALQQGNQTIQPVDIGAPTRGRKIPGSESSFTSRFTARFSYKDFDPQAPTIIAVFFPDGRLINLEADFSKIK